MIDSILLIRPWAFGKKEFPVGLLYVGTALKQKGFKVKIIDFHDNPHLEDEIINIISNSSNTILGISALAPHYRWVKDFSLRLKKRCPEAKIVIGGHISTVYETLLKNTGVDFVCLGEGEETLPDLIEKINNNQSLKNVLGLAHKEGQKIIKNDPRPLLKDFSLPDYGLLNVDRYLIHPTEDLFFNNSPEYKSRQHKDDKLGVIMFSRGCAGACNFCYRHLPGFRQAKIEQSWEHLMFLYKNFGVKYFRIDDELFINDKEWFLAFYKKIKETKIDILFRVTGLRVDSIDEKRLAMLKEIGCIAINYGIESGSQKILDNMNKRTKVQQNVLAIKNSLAEGLQVMAYIIWGYLGENHKTLKETTMMLLNTGLGSDYIGISYAVALPGARIYQSYIKEGKIKNEEEYLLSLSSYIWDERKESDNYVINMSQINKKYLFAWEKTFLFWCKILQRFKKKDSKIRIYILIILESILNKYTVLFFAWLYDFMKLIK